MGIKIPNDVTKWAILRNFHPFAENDPFFVVFSSVSIGRGRGQVLYFVSV